MEPLAFMCLHQEAMHLYNLVNTFQVGGRSYLAERIAPADSLLNMEDGLCRLPHLNLGWMICLVVWQSVDGGTHRDLFRSGSLHGA
ncbi:unnamed protein product [Rhodiola kirilowii]